MNKVLFILLLLPALALADVAPNKRHEISHLMAFILNSNCTMIRNGASHEGQGAIDHIQKKYDYFRDDIRSTEDFIRLSATKSTLSGDYYTVKCKGRKEIKTKDWLLRELSVYRMKRRF